MAAAKAAWLCLALLLWFFLPALLVADRRVSPGLRQPLIALIYLMLIRGVVEAWMLYVSRNWSPWYGIAHDLLCAGALACFALRAQVTNSFERLLRTHLIVTMLAFVPEIYFAWYMHSHFTTQGEDAVYFVPDEGAYTDVLLITNLVVICLGLYLVYFFWRWLHGPFECESATSQ